MMCDSLLWYHNPRRLRTFSRDLLLINVPFISSYYRVSMPTDLGLVFERGLLGLSNPYTVGFAPKNKETIKYTEIDEWLSNIQDYWYLFEGLSFTSNYSIYQQITFFFRQRNDAVMFKLSFT